MGNNEHQVVIGNEAFPSRLPEAGEARLVGVAGMLAVAAQTLDEFQAELV
jgi:hypothetical protein